MLAKPFNLILVYILTVFNFIFLLLPIFAMILPFVDSGEKTVTSELIFANIEILLIWLVFAVSFLMLFYLFLDFLFGFSLRSSLKNCKRYEKVQGCEFLKEIFDQVKKKFRERTVKLYVKESDEINAFAVGSLGRKVIVVTNGLIYHYMTNTQDEEEFYAVVRSVIGHEMSHLINKDFLPALLIIANQKVTNFVSATLQITFKLLVNFLGFFRISGYWISHLIMVFYGIINSIVTFFNNHIVYNIYEFLRKFVSRSIEYRCDRQSAQAFGGYNMGLALTILGDSGYFTLFSTHPSTKRRVKRVEYIKEKSAAIRPSFINGIANYLSLMFLVIICALAAKAGKIDLFVRYYFIENPQMLNQKLDSFLQFF